MSTEPGNRAILELERRHSSGVYRKRELALVRGEGAYVWDAEGRRYLDCVAGHGTAALGHGHPRLVEAVARQAGRLISCPESFGSEVRAALQARLAQLAPAGLSRVYLCSSGAESVEAALKFARLATGRAGLVAARRAFHGRTLGALALTWEPRYRDPFQPLLPAVRHVPYNDLPALQAAVDGETAAVVLEPVQGEGGVHPAEPGYLQGAAEICRRHGALLVLDEVQTGLGRTGRLLACEHWGVAADLLCLAKPLAGGLPMGAVLIGERVGRLPALSHGSTFGGNPLACAAALAVLEVLQEEDLPRRAAELGRGFLEDLRALPSPLVREVRGLGLMVGVELRRRAWPVLAGLEREGVLALPAGKAVVRFLPPLVIGERELAQAAAALGRVLAALEGEDPGEGQPQA